ncbi:MAG: Hsp33 family molecular chaperone HslO [Clostridia bacterium]|nr:Hsp33 family molecular chaperone HslO [Clostridia bacterium]
MKNNGLTILSDNGMVRGFFLNSRNIVQQAFQYHQTAPVVTAALGRLLTASAMMGKMLKNDSDLLTLQIEGEGPVKTILATANRKGQVKGYPGVSIVDIPLKPNGKLDVSGAIGLGTLNVLRDNGEGEPYVSRTELISGEIAEDITHYYATSEQTPTVCALGVLVDRDYSVKSAGGFLLQLLPGADDEVITALENNLQKVQNVSSMFEHTSNQEIANILMENIPFHITEEWGADYFCNCSRERTEKVLLSLGKKDLASLIEEGKPVELCCHFCDAKYQFTPEDMKKLLIQGSKK